MKLVFTQCIIKGKFSHIKFPRLLKDVALVVLLWMSAKKWTLAPPKAIV